MYVNTKCPTLLHVNSTVPYARGIFLSIVLIAQWKVKNMKYGVLLPKRAKWTWLFLGYTYLLFTKRYLLLGCREKFIFLYTCIYMYISLRQIWWIVCWPHSLLKMLITDTEAVRNVPGLLFSTSLTSKCLIANLATSRDVY